METKEYDRRIGYIIRKHRKEIGLSQSALGELSGVNEDYIGSIEWGDQSPTISRILLLSSPLEVSPSLILNEATEMSPYEVKCLEEMHEKRRKNKKS